MLNSPFLQRSLIPRQRRAESNADVSQLRRVPRIQQASSGLGTEEQVRLQAVYQGSMDADG